MIQMSEWKTSNRPATIDNLVRKRRSQGRFYRFKIQDGKLMQRAKEKKSWWSPEAKAQSKGWKSLHWIKEHRISSRNKAENVMLKMKNPDYEYRYFPTYNGSEMAFMRRKRKSRRR